MVTVLDNAFLDSLERLHYLLLEELELETLQPDFLDLDHKSFHGAVTLEKSLHLSEPRSLICKMRVVTEMPYGVATET